MKNNYKWQKTSNDKQINLKLIYAQVYIVHKISTKFSESVWTASKKISGQYKSTDKQSKTNKPKQYLREV